MKKTTLTLASAVGALALIGTLLAVPTIDSFAVGAVPKVCKSEVVDCPGIGTGDKTICVTSGTGVICSCGDATACQ